MTGLRGSCDLRHWDLFDIIINYKQKSEGKMHCIICNTDKIDYPVVDYSTGFTFCNSCDHDTRKFIRKYYKTSIYIDFSQWLIAIGIMRQRAGKFKQAFIK